MIFPMKMIWFCQIFDGFLIFWSIFITFFSVLKLDELNTDPNVHGIIVQMPLDCDEKIDSDLVTDYVSPEKDVDGSAIVC